MKRDHHSFLPNRRIISILILGTSLIASTHSSAQIANEVRTARLQYLNQRIYEERQMLRSIERDIQTLNDSVRSHGLSLIVARTDAAISTVPIGVLGASVAARSFLIPRIIERNFFDIFSNVILDIYRTMATLWVGVPAVTGAIAPVYGALRDVFELSATQNHDPRIVPLDYLVSIMNNRLNYNFLYATNCEPFSCSVEHPSVRRLRRDIDLRANQNLARLENQDSYLPELWTNATYRRLQEVELPRALAVGLLVHANIRYMEYLRSLLIIPSQ